MSISGINVFSHHKQKTKYVYTAKDYLIALKVIREIQRKQAYCSGQSKPYLAETLKEIEMYCPLDFSKSGGRVTEKVILSSYNGNLFST